MNTEHTSPPSMLEQAARQAAEHAARELAKKALVKIGAVLGAKAGGILAVVLAAIALIVLLVVLIVSVAGAAFQSSTAVWPVPVATDTTGAYKASGWTISSRYGWRDNPSGGGDRLLRDTPRPTRWGDGELPGELRDDTVERG